MNIILLPHGCMNFILLCSLSLFNLFELMTVSLMIPAMYIQ